MENRILAAMSEADLATLTSHLEYVDLPHKTVLLRPDEPQAYVYFLESGLASQIASGEGDWRLEVGLYGREGVGPTAALLGVDRCPYLHIMQVGGAGHRIPALALSEAMERSPTLRSLMLRWVQVFMIQIGHTAFANNHARIERRTARWLAMSHDRLNGDELPLTHEFLGIMIGVRRASVSDAMQSLQKTGIIRARRGAIEVLDRARLDEVAAGSYGAPEAEYRRIIGPF